MAADVRHFESSALTERHKVALRLADALMTLPGAIGDDLRQAAREQFDDDELLELTLDVMKWSYQKVAVALGTDDEVAPGRLTDLSFDGDGRPSTGDGHAR